MPLPLLLALALPAALLQDGTRPEGTRGDGLRADNAHLIVAATTDVHGHVTGRDYAAGRPARGGLVRVARVLDSLRARYPGQVVAVDAGDLLQGDPFAAYYARTARRQPHPIVEAMNLAGYDAATPGNHDFDYGVPLMQRALADAAFPYVSANVRGLPADSLVYPASVVLRRDGVRVGITGFTTPGVMVWDQDQVRGRIRVAPIGSAAPGALAALRRQSDIAVVLIHSGMNGPSSYDTTDVGAEDVAATLAGLPARPDLVVVGHSHREMRDSVLRGVHFVQPPPYASGVSVTHLDLVRRGGGWRVVRLRAELIPLEAAPPSERVAARLEPRDADVRDWAESRLGEAVAPMRARAARAGSNAILDFIGAVERRRAGADLAAVSAFDLRAGWDSGAIRMADLLALYPYENTLRAVRISGAQLAAYLEQSARYFRVDRLGRVSINDSMPGFNFDVVAGASYAIDLRRPPGGRIVGLEVRGRPVQPSDSFTLALNSYRQTGTGGYGMLKGAPVVYDRGEDIRGLLVDEVRSRGRLDPADYADGRWRIVPEAMAAQVRTLFGVGGAETPAAEMPAASGRVLLRILSTADLHGHVERAPALKAAFDSLAAECRCPTLRLDAGDEMQGTLLSNATAGRTTIEVMNRLGLSAAAVGNHELDWSVDTLRQRMAESRYPWLVANLFDSATGRRPDWARPYRLLQAGGLRVALIGYITADSRTAVKPERVAGLRFGRGAIALRAVLDSVHALRPDLAILLAHAGALCDGAVCAGEIIELAGEVERGRLDLILAGHTHRMVETRVAGTPILEPGSNGRAFGVTDVVATANGGRELHTRMERVDTTAPGDSALTALVAGYREQLDSVADRVVAWLRYPLIRWGDQNRVGALVAEARRNLLRTDVGLANNGGVRAGLPAGPATFGRLYEVQPFGNGLVRVSLSGAELREVLEHALAGGHPAAHVAGAVVRYDPRRPPGRRITRVTLAGGATLQPRGRYTLATDDFVAQGGDGYALLASLPREPAGIGDVDALAAYLRRLPQPVEIAGDPGFVASR